MRSQPMLSALALAVVTVTTAVTGCTTNPPGDTMTPYEAQTKLVELMDRIQTELGGEWENQDDPSPMSCDLRGGGEGVQFAFSRLGPSPGATEDTRTATGTVTEILIGEGYKVRESGLFNGVYEVTMTNNRGSNILFGANELAMNMAGGSDCVPGDIDQILDDLEQQGL